MDKYRFVKIDGSNSIEVIHGTIWEKTINCINKLVVVGIITAEIKKYDQTKNNFPDI